MNLHISHRTCDERDAVLIAGLREHVGVAAEQDDRYVFMSDSFASQAVNAIRFAQSLRYFDYDTRRVLTDGTWRF